MNRRGSSFGHARRDGSRYMGQRAAASGGGTVYDTVILAGQSNARGNAATSDLWSPYTLAEPSIRQWSYLPDVVYESTAWDDLEPVAASAGFGVELSMMRVLAANGWSNPAVFKSARGSSGIAAHWLPGLGDMWEDTVDAWDLAVAALAPGESLNPRALVWIQGEYDARNATDAGNYETNLTTMIAAFRTQWGAGLPVYLVRLRDPLPAPYTDEATVIAAQNAVAAADANVVILPAAVMYNSDVIHYNAPALIGLGDSLAAKILAPAPALLTDDLLQELDSEIGITSDAFGVTLWEDQSAAGNDAVQSVDLDKPTEVTNATLGQAVQFDGVNEWLNTTGLSSTTGEYTLYFVIDAAHGAATSQLELLFDFNTPRSFGYWNGTTAAGGGLYSSGGYVVQSTVITSIVITAGVHVVRWTIKAGTNESKMHVDGALYGVGTRTPGNLGGAAGLGAQSNGSLPYQGDVSDVLVFEAAHDPVQAETIEAYLRNKRGIS